MEIEEGTNELKMVANAIDVEKSEDLVSKYPAGTFDDLMKARDEVEDIPVAWLEKTHIVKVKSIGWEAYNKIVLATLKELGMDAHPSAYERRKQEQMIRIMVLEIDGHKLTEADWVRIPAPFAEAIRVSIFTNTAELTEMYKEQGLTTAVIRELLSKMNLEGKTLMEKESDLLKN